MAVLVEAVSIIVRLDAIKARYPGDWEAFKANVPNQTLCWDDEISRVGFMSPPDADGYIQSLIENGLRYLDADGNALDLVKIDQAKGVLSPCDWIDAGQIPIDDAGESLVMVARYTGSQDTRLCLPDGWSYEGSLSHIILRKDDVDVSLEFLRHENGNDVFLNKVTGDEVYMGRT